MASQIDNGRRVLLFERHCWALMDLSDKARLAFFDAMLAYGTTGTVDLSKSSGIVRTLLPEITSLSEISYGRAKARIERYKRGTNAEQNGNKTGTNAEQNAPKEKEKEKVVHSTTTSAHTRGWLRPTVEQVISHAETYNWLQYVPGWTMEDLKAGIAETVAELDENAREDGRWLAADGRPVGNWRPFIKAAIEKKFYAARAVVSTVNYCPVCPKAEDEE